MTMLESDARIAKTISKVFSTAFLFVVSETAKMHTANIYGKLG